MEAVLVAVVKEVPSLAIVGFIVYVFVKYLIQSSHAVRDLHTESLGRMERMTMGMADTAKECHATQLKSAAALERNSEALDRFGDKIDHLSDVVEHRYTNGVGK